MELACLTGFSLNQPQKYVSWDLEFLRFTVSLKQVKRLDSESWVTKTSPILGFKRTVSNYRKFQTRSRFAIAELIENIT